jgi:beta-galactosidase
MPVQYSGLFDGSGANYQLVDDKNEPRRDLFDNWVTHLKAWVKAQRNHPSVFLWSVEYQVTYINGSVSGRLAQVEPEIKRGVDEVMALDPTRPAMIDGGNALGDASLPVYGTHAGPDLRGAEAGNQGGALAPR